MGCGALLLFLTVLCGLGTLLLLPRIGEIGARLAGLEPAGRTEDAFPAGTPIPDVVVQNPVIPDRVEIDPGNAGRPLSLDPRALSGNVAIGQDLAGASLGRATFSETDLLNLCLTELVICGAGDGRIRNANIDLRPGGAVINADFYIPQLATWQSGGLVLRLDSRSARFTIIGVDLGGTLYQAPPGQLQDTVNEVTQRGNQFLRDLSIRAGGETLQLAEVYADDTTLTLILR
jgi:hypothetical protein